MGKFWDWLTAPYEKKPSGVNRSRVDYQSPLDVNVDIEGDIDYVLRALPIVTKQLEAAYGRPTDAA